MELFKTRREELKGIPLTDMVGLALNKTTYDQIRSRVESDQSLEGLTPIANSQLARYHRAKILREESTKQFSHEYRPIIELILNGIDARPEEYQGDYFVDVSVTGKEVTIKDRGKGMSLDEVLTTLLIPFSSDKEAEVDIGRFGVGFFSSLGYCLSNPHSSRLEVSTTKEGNNYQLTFGSKSDNVEDLVCEVKRKRRLKSGTSVKVDFKHNKKDLVNYLSQYLSFFDMDRAKIRVNGHIINKGDPILRGASYNVPITFQDGSEDSSRLNFQRAIRKGKNALFSQGVYINSVDFPFFNVKIDFPSKVLLVEGRDEFKQDENYESVSKAVIDFICKHNKEITRDVGHRFEVKEFLMNLIEASSMSEMQFYEVIKGNLPHLFNEGTHIVEDYDRMEKYVDAQDFFGKEVKSKLHAPKTERAFRFWGNILPGYYDFIRDNTEPSETQLDELLDLSPALTHLSKEVSRIHKLDGLRAVHLKDPTETRSPFIRDGGVLYINVQHPLLKEDSFLARYMASTCIGRLLYGEKEAEEIIIK